jgi:hypothetical protein
VDVQCLILLICFLNKRKNETPQSSHRDGFDARRQQSACRPALADVWPLASCCVTLCSVTAPVCQLVFMKMCDQSVCEREHSLKTGIVAGMRSCRLGVIMSLADDVQLAASVLHNPCWHGGSVGTMHNCKRTSLLSRRQRTMISPPISLGLTHIHSHCMKCIAYAGKGHRRCDAIGACCFYKHRLTVLIVPRRSGSVDDTRADDWSSAQSLTHPQLMPALTQVFSLQLQLSQPPLSLPDARDLRPTSSH